MSFIPKFHVGQVVSNNELYDEFQCANMGGMRRSKITNTLVIICDHSKSLYDDKWHGNVLHYTGMGKTGDQTIDGNQNKNLAESDTNGIDVFLFEVMKAGQYTYRGPVRLASKPYQETQPDENGKSRKVWMFPVEAIENQPISKEELEEYIAEREEKTTSLSTEQLRIEAIAHGSKEGANREVNSKVYIRDEFIAEYTKRCANGICELCEKEAPFRDKKGKPYLESHHIIWLSKGGSDTINNTVALCPNCHKKMHIVADKNDIEKLLKKASSRNE